MNRAERRARAKALQRATGMNAEQNMVVMAERIQVLTQTNRRLMLMVEDAREALGVDMLHVEKGRTLGIPGPVLLSYTESPQGVVP